MLRRLKKAKSISELCPGSETLDSKKPDGEDLEKNELQSAKGFDGFEVEDGQRSDLEGLGVEDGVTARKALDFDYVPEFNQTLEDLGEKDEEDEISDTEAQEIKIRDLETEEAGKEHEFDPALEELGEKDEDEMCEEASREEIRDLETEEAGKEHEFDPALEELGEKGEDEI